MTALRPAVLAFVLAVVAPARPALAQAGDPLSIRPFLLAAVQSFIAADAFNATFDTSRGTFVGGGGQVTFGRVFVEVSASRFKRTGERAFALDGDVFRLGIPLTATITPVEFAGGYRARLASAPWFVPYGGAGVGTYKYEETSEFSDPDEAVDVRHAGYLVLGGAEFRLHRYIGVSVDAQYTRIPGILGDGGLSQVLGEDDLGGVAARFRVIVGR